MILFVLCISAFLFFICFNLLTNNKVLHAVTSIVFSVLFILSTFFITINFHDHYGMHKVSHEKTTNLVSSLPETPNTLIYSSVGTSGKDKVIIYRSDNKENKAKHTTVNKIENKIIRTSESKAQLVTKTINYEYDSKLNSLWFGLAQKPSRFKTVNYFYVPKSWKVASAKDAGEVFVKAQVKEAFMKDPMNAAKQQKSLVNKARTEFQDKIQGNAIEKMVKHELKG